MGLLDKMKDAASQAVGQAQAGLDKARHDFTSARSDEPQVLGGAPADATQAAGPRPILELVSHIDGKNAKVRLWPDRIEWERPRGISGGKITAGVLTAGTSLLVTGVKGGKDEHDVVLLKHVTSVTSRKDGVMYYAVDVQTSSGAAVNTIVFRVSKDEAAQFRSAILNAMRDLDEKANAPVVVHVDNAPAAPAAPAAVDYAAQLQQLASLRDAGILSEGEFAAKKAEILGRM